MDLMVYDVSKKLDAEVEAKLIAFLKEHGLDFKITECSKSAAIPIDSNDTNSFLVKPCCSSDIIIQTSEKTVSRIHPCDIIYIAIENRKSAVYVDGKRIQTNYPLSFWKESLDSKIFAQPHSSFLVNLCYVDKVTKDFVEIKHKGKEYSVYTSSRKLNNFKKAFYALNK